MKNYFLAKLFSINYRIAIHEGNANRRLASEAPKILFQLTLGRRFVPKKYIKEFSRLINLIDKTLEESQGRIPVRIIGIQNKTAAKYIKLLIDIKESIEN